MDTETLTRDDRISPSLGELIDAFAEWDRRYREEPERFMSEVEHLLRTTPEGYGELAGRYFVKIVGEMS